jgi:hypothetical protein
LPTTQNDVVSFKSLPLADVEGLVPPRHDDWSYDHSGQDPDWADFEGFIVSRDEVDRLAALRQPSSRPRRPPVQTLFDKWALASDPALSDHQGEGERSWT